MFNRFIAAMRAVAGEAGHNMLYLTYYRLKFVGSAETRPQMWRVKDLGRSAHSSELN